MAKDKKLYVCCPDDFYRKANVEIVCNRFEVPLYNEWNSFIHAMKHKFVRVVRNKEYYANLE